MINTCKNQSFTAGDSQVAAGSLACFRQVSTLKKIFYEIDSSGSDEVSIEEGCGQFFYLGKRPDVSRPKKL